jgi:putative ABC transport system permease protein
MFRRIFLRELRASRARLALALLVVVSGAAVVSALLNVQLDIDSKLGRTFRVFGANVVITPQAKPSGQALLPDFAWNQVAARESTDRRIAAAAPFLYLVAHVTGANASAPATIPAIVAGTKLSRVRAMNSWWKVEGHWPASASEALVGSAVARKLKLAPGAAFHVRYGSAERAFTASGVVVTGGPEDNQIFTPLATAQDLAGLDGKISLVQLSVAGSAGEIRGEMNDLSAAIPGAIVRPIPEFTTGEAQLARKIRLLVGATIALILALTVLGVLASMAALATERRHHVGVMKAIGGPTRRIIRLFLAEVGLLAIAGTIAGCALGFPLSSWISERAFGSGASPDWIVVPLVAALMFGAALAGALPLRLLGRVRPAVILRGEGWSL